MTDKVVNLTNNPNQEIIVEYFELSKTMMKIKGGRLNGIKRKEAYRMYERLCCLHLEMVARGLMEETKLERIGGKTNTENITRETIHRPEKKKLGKKKKGGRRRV